MPRHVTYVGKHSKDRSVSVYLPKRVYVDEGDGVEPVSGIVRILPDRARQLPEDQGFTII